MLQLQVRWRLRSISLRIVIRRIFWIFRRTDCINFPHDTGPSQRLACASCSILGSYLFHIQKIWANAHETLGSISLILYAGCLGLSVAISAQIKSTCASQPEIAKHSLKPIFWVQGRSRSSTLVPPESSPAVLVRMRSKSLSICNHSLVDWSTVA